MHRRQQCGTFTSSFCWCGAIPVACATWSLNKLTGVSAAGVGIWERMVFGDQLHHHFLVQVPLHRTITPFRNESDLVGMCAKFDGNMSRIHAAACILSFHGGLYKIAG